MPKQRYEEGVWVVEKDFAQGDFNDPCGHDCIVAILKTHDAANKWRAEAEESGEKFLSVTFYEWDTNYV